MSTMFKVICFNVVIIIFICTTHSLYAYTHVCMYVYESVCMCVCLSSCLSVCLTVCLSFYLCVPLSLPLFLSPMHRSISPWISTSPPPLSFPPSLPHCFTPPPPHTLLSDPSLCVLCLSNISLYLQHVICGGVLFRINTAESCRPRRQGVCAWTTWGRNKSRAIREGPTSFRIQERGMFGS